MPRHADVDPAPRPDGLRTDLSEPDDDPFAGIDPADMGEKVAHFDGYVMSAAVMRNGGLQVNLGVPFTDKYKAMPVTDVRGELFTVVVFKKAWPEGEEPDDPEDGPTDVGDPIG